MTGEKRHDGWSNYETWCVHSWLTNDEEAYEYWREEAGRCREEARSSEEVRAGMWAADQLEQFALADQLKDEVEHDGGCSCSSLYTDLIQAALSEVNWLEIAEAILDGLEQDGPQPESADEPAHEDDKDAFSAEEFERAKRERTERGIRPLFELGRIVATPGALATIDPDDIFTFIDGRLGERFIHSPADIARRLADFEWQPDVEGRYRVNECYCHDTTWQQALAALVRASDVVLMDLRNFVAQNEGCLHELRVLATTSGLARVVVLINERTQLPAAQAAIAEATATAPTGRFVWLAQQGEVPPATEKVLELLFVAAER